MCKSPWYGPGTIDLGLGPEKDKEVGERTPDWTTRRVKMRSLHQFILKSLINYINEYLFVYGTSSICHHQVMIKYMMIC